MNFEFKVQETSDEAKAKDRELQRVRKGLGGFFSTDSPSLAFRNVGDSTDTRPRYFVERKKKKNANPNPLVGDAKRDLGPRRESTEGIPLNFESG